MKVNLDFLKEDSMEETVPEYNLAVWVGNTRWRCEWEVNTWAGPWIWTDTYSSTHSQFNIMVLGYDIMITRVVLKNPSSMKLPRGKDHTNSPSDSANRVLQTGGGDTGASKAMWFTHSTQVVPPWLLLAQRPNPTFLFFGHPELLLCMAKELFLRLN